MATKYVLLPDRYGTIVLLICYSYLNLYHLDSHAVGPEE